MTGAADTAGGRPLRPGDPRRMGRYELTGRLGEGGMGTVYLAKTPEGRQVAVKIIKADLADDPQFRQRFRTEVARAQDVPPFCTAEVLDADPDHDQPYLVVEYVAGPSLATVVAEHGPLTSANLHGLAIGVATALTAIHGAGVIHRDLKPSNVLLAPGSPKVIDFGIARAVEGAVSHTRTDQMVGTVTYMAPERFDSSNGRILSPAADIFAWGAVIAYAGTGRTPFAADLPHMVAVRILTMPPDLEGLSGPLRDLVEQALAKDPAERPTARELLDRLLTTGPMRTGEAAGVLEGRPALREAVADARAADDVQARERTATAIPSVGSETTRFHMQGRVAAGGDVPVVSGGGSARPGGAADASALTRPGSPGGPGGSARPGGSAHPGGPAHPSGTAFPGGSADPGGSARPGGPAHPGGTAFPGGSADPGGSARPGGSAHPGGPAFAGGSAGPGSSARPVAAGKASRRGFGRTASVILAFTTVVAVSVLAGVVYGLAADKRDNNAGQGVGTSAPASSAPAPSAPSGAVTVISDPLTTERDWRVVLDPANKASCEFDDALVVKKGSSGLYRCPGPRRLLTDFTATVTTKLLTEDACAAVWLRFDKVDATATREAGYVLAVCADGYRIMTHGAEGASDLAELAAFPFDEPAELSEPIAVGINADGPRLSFTRDGKEVGSRKDTRFKKGRVVFGVLNMSEGRSTVRVSFNDVEIRA